jgi:hypothetical protein
MEFLTPTLGKKRGSNADPRLHTLMNVIRDVGMNQWCAAKKTMKNAALTTAVAG